MKSTLKALIVLITALFRITASVRVLACLVFLCLASPEEI